MIPLFKPSCTDDEVEAVTRVLRSGWWGLGPETEKFEQEFADYTGTAYAVAVNSATSALELAARATDVTNTTVVTTALTFVSTAQAMQHAGNRVVFADINEEDLCLDWDDAMDKADASGATAIVPVWFGGRVVHMRDVHLKVIEDCAHAAGSAGAGKQGTACWSFQAVKNLAVGDGGMVTTNDPEVYARLKPLRWCGIDKSTWERDRGKYGWDYAIPADGEKMHMNDIAAALGRVQLRRLNQMNELRRTYARYYNSAFRDLDWLKTPALSRNESQHLYVIRVPAEHRDRFIDHMLSNGVSAGVHYKPLTHYPHLFGVHRLPVTERVWETMVTIPLYPDMTLAEQAQVISTVRSFPI